MANEKRLIDANAVCMIAEELLRCNFFNDIEYDAVICAAEDAPTVDAVEVVHGRWVEGRFRQNDGAYEEKCSRCSEWSVEYGKPFCTNCGAKMDLED